MSPYSLLLWLLAVVIVVLSQCKCFSLWRKIVETPYSGVILQETHTQGQVGGDIGGEGGHGDKEKCPVDSKT